MRPVSSSSEAQCTISEEAHMRGKVESEYDREGEGGQSARARTGKTECLDDFLTGVLLAHQCRSRNKPAQSVQHQSSRIGRPVASGGQ